MRSAHAVGHGLGRGAAVTVLLVVSAGCGGATSPAESVPELDAALARVDRALAAGDLLRAQRRLDRLVRITVTARRSGDLESAESDAILAAAAGLSARLPRGGPLPQVTEPAPPDGGGDADDPVEEPASKGGGVGEEEAEKRAEELQKEREELQEQREELQKELEKKQEEKQQEEGEKAEGKGGGSGNSSGSGSDHGHGN